MDTVQGLEQDGGRVAARPLPSRKGSRQWPNRGLSFWTGPWAAVAAVVAWSLWEMRATALPVEFADDSSVHEQMVRFAAAQIRAGHDPLTAWFPYLGLGSPHFLHYQSTPAVLTSLAGLVVGPDAAFRWSSYLLWCLWPMAIYASARLFGLARPAAVLSAVVAPLLRSVPGVGYEQHAYVWAGYGVWTQLWASWALPFAWALTWRAVADKRFIAPAAGLVALTVAFHYETGYLAFGAIVIMPFLIRAGQRARLARAAAVLATSLLASAWVIVPLLKNARWAGINQAMAGTPLARGYGAHRTLGWFFTGQLLDYGRLPVVTALAMGGLVIAVLRWRQAGPGRALVALFCMGLMLSFGRTTFGGLASIIPGSTDLFFRRFLMGGQLAAIYLAGLGGAEAGRQGMRLAGACARFLTARRLAWAAWMPMTALVVLPMASLLPAWQGYDSYAAANATDIKAQRLAEQKLRPQVAAVAAFIRGHGDGRAWAGSPGNGGRYFTVGMVPVYAYLESRDIDEVGMTLRTASLMSQPEYWFDPANPGDYALFGIRYLVLPARAAPPPRPWAVLVLRNSAFQLYELPGNSYFRVIDTVGSIAASRVNVGSQSVRYLRSALPGQGRYLTVAYAGARLAKPTWRLGTRPGRPPGFVLAQHTDLAAGNANAVVRLDRPAVVVLSASYDPGWSVTVNGRPAVTEMVAPALVGVAMPPGAHHIAFRYNGFRSYPLLLALAIMALLAVTVITRTRLSVVRIGSKVRPRHLLNPHYWPMSCRAVWYPPTALRRRLRPIEHPDLGFYRHPLAPPRQGPPRRLDPLATPPPVPRPPGPPALARLRGQAAATVTNYNCRISERPF